MFQILLEISADGQSDVSEGAEDLWFDRTVQFIALKREDQAALAVRSFERLTFRQMSK